MAQIILDKKHSLKHLKILKLVFVLLFFFLAMATTVLLLKPFTFLSFLLFILKFFLGWFLYRSLQTIQYSFWTIFFIINVLAVWDAIILLRGLDSLFALVLSSFFYLVSLIIFYEMRKVVYYPRVNWWDYDFRLRKDISVNVRIIDLSTTHVARIVDVQNHGLSLASFELMAPDICLSLSIQGEFEGIQLKQFIFTVSSRRTQLFGRPFVYTLVPDLHRVQEQTEKDELAKVAWKKFVHYWKKATPSRKFEPVGKHSDE